TRTGAVRPIMFVGSLAVARTVPGVVTATMFVICGGAFGSTFTVRVIGAKLAPAASDADCVQVNVASAQHHPLPLIAVAVRPAGRVSTTVTVPDVAPGPLFVTVIVYVAPVWPKRKFPECVLLICISDAGAIPR